MPATPNPRPFRYEWDGTLRRLALSPTVKLVAAYASQYADTDGRHIRPGIDRLAVEAGLSEKTIRRTLAALRDLGLLTRIRSGSSQGRRGQADEYRLTIPDDILDRVDLVEPIAVPTPVDRAAKPVDNSAHRARNTGHQMTGDSTKEPPEHRTPDDRRSDGTPDIEVPEHRTSGDRPPTMTTPALPTTPTTGVAHQPDTHAARDPTPSVDNPQISRCRHGQTRRSRRDGTPRCQQCREERAA